MNLRVVVIGAGAVGGWVGGRLALAGHRVTLVGRQPLAEAVAAEGLVLRSPQGTETVVHNIQVVTSIQAATSHAPFDLALFTVKAYDTATAIAEMQTADLGRPVVVSLQNGVQSEPALASAWGPERVVAGVELNPISVPRPGLILLEKQRGGIGLAPVDAGASVDRWVRLFDGAVLPTRAYDDHRALKWSKLLLNLIGNASAAILDMNTAQVYAHRHLMRLEIEMLREAVAVMRGLGISPVPLPGYPVPLLAWAVRRLPWWTVGPVLRRMVVGGRGQKPPSLLLALRHNRRRSEVEHLNGAVVRAGEQVGIATPVNRALTETLSRLVDGRITWANVRHRPDVLLAVTDATRQRA